QYGHAQRRRLHDGVQARRAEAATDVGDASGRVQVGEHTDPFDHDDGRLVLVPAALDLHEAGTCELSLVQLALEDIERGIGRLVWCDDEAETSLAEQWGERFDQEIVVRRPRRSGD